MQLSRFEIKTGDLLDSLRAAGFDAEVEQTGGNTATVRASKDGITLLGGPGYFDCAEPRDSIIHTGDFWVGPEFDDESAAAVNAGDTAEQITALFVKVLG